MKKRIFLIIIVLVFICMGYYIINQDDITINYNKDEIMAMKKIEEKQFNSLDNSKFFSKGVITYNAQKILYKDYKNNLIWENENKVFLEGIYTDDNNIYKCLENGLEILNKSNQSYTVTDIYGKIIYVSRETMYRIIISQDNVGRNYLYLLNESNEILLDKKQYMNSITGVSVNEKSNGYVTSSLKFENNTSINNITYNLIDNLQIWDKRIENEIVVNVKCINNNILVIGTENIYFYNLNGNLLWKNCNYNKLIDYHIETEENKFYLLLEKEKELEIICYNLEGKVKGIHKVTNNISNFKVIKNNIYIFNKSMIGILNGDGVNILYQKQGEEIIDFKVEHNNLYILFKDKLIKSYIK